MQKCLSRLCEIVFIPNIVNAVFLSNSAPNICVSIANSSLWHHLCDNNQHVTC